MSPRIVGFSGSTRRPSRTRALVEAVASELQPRRAGVIEIFDLADAGPEIGATSLAALPAQVRALIAALEEADGLIIGSPVYKGSFAGLFKHVIDFVDPAALAGKPVVLTATGGGHRHALVVEHQLRPLFGFFSAQTIPTALYAGDQDFKDGSVADPALRARIAQAAAEFDHTLQRRGPVVATGSRSPISNVA